MSEETTPGPEGASADERYMRLALALGRRNLGRTWPNPAVGAVIVKDGLLVGRGWTAKRRPSARRSRGAPARKENGAGRHDVCDP